jgi:hypothetical protein
MAVTDWAPLFHAGAGGAPPKLTVGVCASTSKEVEAGGELLPATEVASQLSESAPGCERVTFTVALSPDTGKV